MQQSGLTADQAIIYEALLKNGVSKAGVLTSKTPLKRGLVYKLLDQLVEMGIVEKEEKEGAPTVFKPAHPLKLKELAEKRERSAKDAQIALENVMSHLISNFNLISGQPNIRFFEGVEGLQKIYDDILAAGDDFYLVRSIYEPTYNKKILPVVEKFIKQRVKKNIKVTALTPLDEYHQIHASKEKDQAALLNRISITKQSYNAPVEIDIYGSKVAFLSFGKELIGVIIESPQIALALKQLFLLSVQGAKTTANEQMNL